ncbi:hypothetical protein BLA29_001741 [Euroglyphus maynei]|uniref:Uncharacterized protein n=1 Tax=Euroglyphus maynei TaxID=6958 RepID=A0A1Y3BU57_EURMA|nr:hypothetical protein BLA29_001741 [Euroglyphus maynei]
MDRLILETQSFRAISVDKTLTQLQQQIELASKIGNFTFINEIAIENFIKNVCIINKESTFLLFDKQYRNHINSLLSYLVYLFETNSDANKQWLIHLMVRKFFDSQSNIDDVISSANLKQKVRLLADENYVNLSMICPLKLPVLHPCATDFYRRLKISNNNNESLAEDGEYIQSLCVKLRNSLYQDPITTSIVIEILANIYDEHSKSQSNIFEKIYSQALIHTLKNQNRQLMIKILLRCPDSVYDNDDNLIKQVMDCLKTSTANKLLNQSESDLMSLYSYGLFAHSERFIRFIADISHQQRQYSNIHTDETFFNLKQSFLMAVEDREHFLRKFIDYHYDNPKQNDENSTLLSLKSRIILTILSLYHIINNYEDIHRMQDQIVHIESTLCSLFNRLNHHHNEQFRYNNSNNHDEYLIRIVNKLDFVFKFADWCSSNNNNNSHNERSKFRLEIIAGLMTGTSPLKILSNFNFFQLINEKSIDYCGLSNDYITCDYICELINNFDHNIAVILKGFIIIRLVIFCIFFTNDRNPFNEKFSDITNRLQYLLQDIDRIEFRMEIMENLFSLLFLTKNDFKNNNDGHHYFKSDDEDYLDETISSTKQTTSNSSQRIRHKSMIINRSINNFSTANFICPNWLIPKLLEVLEAMLYKTNSDLFNCNNSSERSTTNNNNHIDEQLRKNLKGRISRLLEYVSDARFRYDVIRPAFFRQTTMVDQSQQPEQRIDDLNRHYSISTSSDTDYKQHSNQDTSLISCMLASYTQLLCYTLAENRLDSSRQIAKLFANDLQNSKPYKELQLLLNRS